MAIRLKDMKITHISLVKHGANKKNIIYKSGNYTKDLKIVKKDNEKGIIYGIVYSPDEIDLQGEFASKEDIEKAAYGFMQELCLKNVDKEHNFKALDAFVCESWLVRKNDPIFSNEKEGSWAVGIKLLSDELKEAVKKGEINSLSMAGEAIRVEDRLNLFFKNMHEFFTKKGEKMEIKEEQKETSKDDVIKEIQGLKTELELIKAELKKSKQETKTNNEIEGML